MQKELLVKCRCGAQLKAYEVYAHRQECQMGLEPQEDPNRPQNIEKNSSFVIQESSIGRPRPSQQQVPKPPQPPQRQSQSQRSDITDSLIRELTDRCEFCQEYFPKEIFNQHLEHCDVKEQILLLQQQYQSEDQLVSEIPRQEVDRPSDFQSRLRDSEIFSDDDSPGLLSGPSFFNRSRNTRTVQTIRTDSDGRKIIEKRVNNQLVQRQVIGPNGEVIENQEFAPTENRRQRSPEELQRNMLHSRLLGSNLFSSLFGGNRGPSILGPDSSLEPQSMLFHHDRRRELEALMSILLQRQGIKKENLENFQAVKFQPTAGLADEHRKCTICITLYDANDDIIILPCMHRFHKDCIFTWLKDNRTCPICKLNIQQALQENGENQFTD